jgi:diacylglycerol kinase family enzyme
MRVLLLVNPTASGVTPGSRVAVENVLASRHELLVTVTASRDHATELARQAARDGIEVVVVLGGDGTLNETANGLVGSATALGALPGGSTSVFARTIGFTDDLETAVAELDAALDRGSRRRVALGKANGRHYLFNLGVGYDAEVVERVEGMGALKRRLGQAAFVLAGLATWLGQADRSSPRLTVRVTGDDSAYAGSFVLCLKSNPYTFFGRRPLNVAPGTGFGTGLSVAILRDLRLATLGPAMRSVFGDGQDLADLPRVTLLRDVEGLTVTAEEPFAHQVDGDYLGWVDHLEVGVEPDCLDVVVP